MSTPVEIVKDFVFVKRFCYWLAAELTQGTLLLTNEADRVTVISACRSVLESYKPHYVAYVVNEKIWPALNAAVELRALEVVTRAASAADWFTDENAELFITRGQLDAPE